MTDMESTALKTLRALGDDTCYAQMIQSLLRGEAEVIACREDGVLTRHRLEKFYMLAGSVACMTELAGQIPAGEDDVLLHGALTEETVAYFRDKLGMKSVTPYVMYAYYGDMPPEETQVAIRSLDEQATEFVYENYGHASREYLAYLLRKGVMIGAYVGEEMVGFIGEHAAGAMGLLHVMPAYRRHHLGYALERADIRRIMLSGQTPFCQVAVDNIASHKLQERLGMTRAKGRMYWMSALG